VPARQPYCSVDM